MIILDSEKEEKFTESEKMIECLKSGDDEAFSKFYESYKAPLYDFLSKRCGVHNLQEFKQAAGELLKTVDLKKKQKKYFQVISYYLMKE